MLSEQLYTEYVRQYTDSMLRIAVNYCRQLSDAEDIVQDAFLKLYETDTPFKDSEHVKRWLIRVTINTCKNHLSSAWRRKIQPMGFQELELAAEHSSGSDSSWMSEFGEASALFEAVAALPEKYRSTVHLYYFESYSVRDIAQILQKKESAIQTRLMRARKMLKQQLKGAWHDES